MFANPLADVSILIGVTRTDGQTRTPCIGPRMSPSPRMRLPGRGTGAIRERIAALVERERMDGFIAVVLVLASAVSFGCG